MVARSSSSPRRWAFRVDAGDGGELGSPDGSGHEPAPPGPIRQLSPRATESVVMRIEVDPWGLVVRWPSGLQLLVAGDVRVDDTLGLPLPAQRALRSLLGR
jgi:hypothetical protein